MTVLAKWQPFRELTSSQERLNRMFDEPFPGNGVAERSSLTASWFAPSPDGRAKTSFWPIGRISLTRLPVLVLLALVVGMFLSLPAISPAQQVPLSPPQLDQFVQRIALYPDPLLAQVLTASTYWNEIPDAAAWADQHSYLKGDALAHAIQDDHLQWDASVLALLPFPSVLDMMAQDPGWTEQLGNAVLTQRSEVMDAVQRMRRQAKDYGYLTPNGYLNVVTTGGYIEILPVNPGVVMCPIMILLWSSRLRARALLLQPPSTSARESQSEPPLVPGVGGSAQAFSGPPMQS